MVTNPGFVGPRRRPIKGSRRRKAIDRVVEARRQQKVAISTWEYEGGSIAASKTTQRC